MAQIEEFASQLMTLVRDRAIRACDGLIGGAVGGSQAVAWAAVVDNLDVRNALTQLVPDMVDQVLFELLNAVDQEELDLSWRSAGGEPVSLVEAGDSELAGWLLMSGEGWRERYSNERINDYNSGLRLIVDWDSPEG